MLTNAIDPSVLRQVNQQAGNGARDSEDMHENFMRLLVAQLQNQDPMNPMENAEMTSQLAQINTVSGIEELNSTLDLINGQMDASKMLDAANLIGKAVLVPGERILVGQPGDITPYGIDLNGPAEQVQVHIKDSGGQVVRSMDLGSLAAGEHTLDWDGLLADGTEAPAGSYRFEVEASMDGERVGYQGMNYAEVVAVSNDRQGPLLDLGGIQDPVRLEEIQQII